MTYLEKGAFIPSDVSSFLDRTEFDENEEKDHILNQMCIMAHNNAEMRVFFTRSSFVCCQPLLLSLFS